MNGKLLLLSQEQAHLQSWIQTPNRKTIFGKLSEGRRGKSFVRGTQPFKENLKIPNKTWTGRRMNALRVVQSLNEF